MEGIGPDANKRPRLDLYSKGAHSAHRTQHTIHQPQQHQQPQQQQSPEVSSSHNYSHAHSHTHVLPPPTPAYNHPVPASPYTESPGEHRSLPEPSHHSYAHTYSGHNTPIREHRSFPPELDYSRHGSLSAPTRSPNDGPRDNQLRPLNTTSANEGLHYPHHSHPERPSTGYTINEGHPNGNAHSLAMSSHLDSAPTHSASGHLGAYPNSPVSNGPSLHAGSGGQYNAPQISPWIQRPARKNTRAQQACDTCRTRKAKCDEGKPSCGYCLEMQLICNYKEVAPAKADRAQKEIMDRLDKLDRLQSATDEKLDKLQATLDKLMKTGRSPSPVASQSTSEIHRIPPHVDKNSPDKKVEVDDDNPPPTRPPGKLDSGASDENVRLSNGSVGIDHITAAHRLLRWPTIRNLIKRYKVSEDYVMSKEEEKGLLRIYGTGQGGDSLDDMSSTTSSPAPGTPFRRGEDPTRTQVHPSPNLWGTGGFEPPRIVADHPGGLDADGNLKLDSRTMFRLVDSYINNIHVMQPFLDKGRLNQMVERLASHKQPLVTSSGPSPYASYNSIMDATSPPNKRKYEMSSPSEASIHPNQPLERRISNAIVLLVMALGKICEHKKDLPGPAADKQRESPYPVSYSPSNQGSPASVSLKPSPSPSTASIYNNARSPQSELHARIWGRGISEENSPQTRLFKDSRNVDVIPGLAYFAYATDILGNQHGGLDLPHVQANLLAGLYMGQLACTFESWSWITTACSICNYMVRDPLLKNEKNLARRDAIQFAYYTCLQLESDILAELDLPRSGIDRAGYQDFVKYPQGISETISDTANLDEPIAKILAYYSAQIHLRTMLNKIQMALYPAGANQARIPLEVRDECQDMLEQWRSVLPLMMMWEDEDELTKDINEARLRAKFYGAQYIIHRPFLHYALHSPEFQERPDTIDPKYREEIMKSAKTCVKAAHYSTLAFDGVMGTDNRLIVTGIFGTAHAQFGNMLVLAATYRSSNPELSKLVNKQDLLRLLDRTISFLRRLKNISETLKEDSRILEVVRQVVNNGDPLSSFSSTSS